MTAMNDKQKTEAIMIGSALIGLMTRPTPDLAEAIVKTYGSNVTIMDGVGMMAVDFGRATVAAMSSPDTVSARTAAKATGKKPRKAGGK